MKFALYPVFVVCTTVLSALSFSALAQSYPTRTVTFVLPFAPGSGLDVIAHLLGTKLGESLRQAVVVENRAGAGGAVGSEYVARAAPDGHTLLIGNNSTYGVNQAFNPKQPVDIIRDFTPISVIAEVPELLMVTPTVAANSVKEFIALAKEKPGQLNFASAGAGSNSHLMAELFNFVAGIKMVHVPYKGAAPGMTAAMSGEVQMVFAVASGAMPNVQSGKLKAIGITGIKRSPLRPQLPTLSEQSVNGFESGVSYAMVGPARLPAPIVTRLNQEIVKIINTAEVRDKLLALNTEPVAGTPEACGEFIRTELAKWTKLIKETGIKSE